MRILKKLVSFLYVLIEKMKGTKTVREIHSPENALGHLTAYSISGYEITIYCQKRHYRRDYDRWFIPNENHIAYRVFARVSNDAPERLKKACELDIDIPALLPPIVNQDDQRNAAVQAYLDLLIERLGTDVNIAA